MLDCRQTSVWLVLWIRPATGGSQVQIGFETSSQVMGGLRWDISIELADPHHGWQHLDAYIIVPSLGLLLGRDFLESVGANMSVANRVIKFEFLQSSALPLKQLAAGHYMLPLMPSRWEGVGTQKWRRLGVDGVCEVQLSVSQWLKVKLAASQSCKSLQHEHYLTEPIVKASRVVLGLAELNRCSSVQAPRSMSPGARAPK